MNHPQKGDYIDIHVHDGKAAGGVFILDTLMAHEYKMPAKCEGVAYTYGIHHWFLHEDNYIFQLEKVRLFTRSNDVIAIGEAGFDKLRGPSVELQRKVFREQVSISEELEKPLIIHCVRSWEEILGEHKVLKPKMPWMIHGFRGKIPLAGQLLSKGFYLSLWFEYVLRPDSAPLLKAIDRERVFLETDGAPVDIKEIYRKAANGMGIDVEELKTMIYNNYNRFFEL